MRSISEDLRSVLSTKVGLREAFEQVLLFGIQWEDMEERFDSVAKSIDGRFKILSARERFADERMRAVESKEKEAVALLRKKVEKCDAEVLEKKGKLDLLERRIQERARELKENEDELVSVRVSVEECLRRKQLELDELQKKIQAGSEKLSTTRDKLSVVWNSLMKSSRELDEKRNILSTARDELRDCSCEVDSKRDKLRSVQCDMDNCSKQLELRKELLRASDEAIELKNREMLWLQNAIEERAREVELKEEHLRSIRTRIDECKEELKSKERDRNAIEMFNKSSTAELDLKKSKLVVLEKSFKDLLLDLSSRVKSFEKEATCCSEDLQFGKEELPSPQGTIGKVVIDHELEEREHAAIHTSDELASRCNECDQDVEVTRKQHHILEVSSKKPLEMLTVNKKQSEDLLEQLESEQEQLQRTEIESRERSYTTCGQVKVDGPSGNVPAPKDAMDLKLFICEFLERHDLVRQTALDVIRSSLDPAKLVLEVLQDLESPSPTNQEWKLKIGSLKWGCLLLLGLLSEVSPEITPQVKAAAAKLASEWKAQMGASSNHYFEVLALLRLLVVYELASAFCPEELGNLIDSLSDYKQADELRKALGLSREMTPHLPTVSMVHVPGQGMKTLRIEDYLHVQPQHVNKHRRSAHDRLGPPCRIY